MTISNLKRSTAHHVADNAAGKNTDRGKNKADFLHAFTLTKVASISLALMMVTALPAQAHTALISSTPANKETVQSFPTEISLTFNEPLMTLGGKQVSKFSVLNPDRKPVELGALRVNEATISASVAPQDEIAGTYKIYYRVISADGHPVSGILTFNNQSVSKVYTIATPEEKDSDSITHWIIHHKWHILETVAALIFIFSWWIYRRRNRK